jgi:glutathione peroxidase
MMTIRQKISSILYPLIMKGAKNGKLGKVLQNKNQVSPKNSFYSLKGTKGNGEELDFSAFKNKKVLIVNTASNCGFTNQYSSLQALFEKENNNLIILGFPSNEFKQQERADDKGIAEFCQVNFGVTFPLMKKSIVLKKNDQNEIYQWLTNKDENGWNTHAPDWNFSKYLIDENGTLQGYYGSGIEPEKILS